MAGIKRKAEMEIPITDENDLLKITPLGSGNEVGRSSILLEYKGKTILVSFLFSIFYCDNYHNEQSELDAKTLVKLHPYTIY
jgi:predicted metal-dependent RNase